MPRLGFASLNMTTIGKEERKGGATKSPHLFFPPLRNARHSEQSEESVCYCPFAISTDGDTSALAERGICLFILNLPTLRIPTIHTLQTTIAVNHIGFITLGTYLFFSNSSIRNIFFQCTYNTVFPSVHAVFLTEFQVSN